MIIFRVLISFLISLTVSSAFANSNGALASKHFADYLATTISQGRTLGELASNIPDEAKRLEVSQYLKRNDLDNLGTPKFTLKGSKINFKVPNGKIEFDFALFESRPLSLTLNGRVYEIKSGVSFSQLTKDLHKVAGSESYYTSTAKPSDLLLPKANAGVAVLGTAIVATGVGLYAASEIARPCYQGGLANTAGCLLRQNDSVIKKLTLNRPIRSLVCENGAIRSVSYYANKNTELFTTVEFSKVGTSTTSVETSMTTESKVKLCKYSVLDNEIIKVEPKAGTYLCPGSSGSRLNEVGDFGAFPLERVVECCKSDCAKSFPSTAAANNNGNAGSGSSVK